MIKIETKRKKSVWSSAMQT